MSVRLQPLRSATSAAAALALPIVGGLALTVILAWGCAAFGPGRDGSFGHVSADHPMARRWFPDDPRLRFGIRWVKGVGWTSDEVFGVRSDLQANAPENYRVRVTSAGWPFLCLEGATIVRNGVVEHKWNAWPDSWRLRRAGMLPYRPLPRPFVLNALLFTAAILAARFTTRAITRFTRRRRGRCARCGYRLHGAMPNRARACPECGDVGGSRPRQGR